MVLVYLDVFMEKNANKSISFTLHIIQTHVAQRINIQLDTLNPIEEESCLELISTGDKFLNRTPVLNSDTKIKI